MVEVGIPIYQARETIRATLDSLLIQTQKIFSVCFSIDGGDDDYSDLVSEYTARGLKIRVVKSKENLGPGAARQRVIDTTACEYVMFLDADDLLMPSAVHDLYEGIKTNDLDILRSGFIHENSGGSDILFQANTNVITWMHGKIYRVEFLKKNNIRFLEGLRADEDAYFNQIAWYSTDKKGELNGTTYFWRDNIKSLTRRGEPSNYFKQTYYSFVHSQLKSLEFIYNKTNKLDAGLFGNVMINMYYYYNEAKYRELDYSLLEKDFYEFGKYEWVKDLFKNSAVWNLFIEIVKSGGTLKEGGMYFFEVNMRDWVIKFFNLTKEEINDIIKPEQKREEAELK